MPGTFEILADAGYAEFEIGGDYDGRRPAQVRQLAETYGLRVAGNHFGPRSIIQNIWYDPNERARIYQEAHAMGLRAVGTGHSYTAPRTVDGYKEMAAAFNVWGEEAVRNGFEYFYFHNQSRQGRPGLAADLHGPPEPGPPPLLRRARRRGQRRDGGRHLAAAAQPAGLGQHRVDRPQIPGHAGDPEEAALTFVHNGETSC
jgi:hypothetical protein